MPRSERFWEARGAGEERAEKARDQLAFSQLASCLPKRVEWADKPRYRWNR